MFFFFLVSSCVLLTFRLPHFSNSFCWLLSLWILGAMNYCSVFVALGSCAGRKIALTSWVLMQQGNLDPVKPRVCESGWRAVTVALLCSHLHFLWHCLTQEIVSSVVTHCSSWEPALWQGVCWKNQLSTILCFVLLLRVMLWSPQHLSCRIPWCPGSVCCQQLSFCCLGKLVAALQSHQRVPCWMLPPGLHACFCLADFIISTASPA